VRLASELDPAAPGPASDCSDQLTDDDIAVDCRTGPVIEGYEWLRVLDESRICGNPLAPRPFQYEVRSSPIASDAVQSLAAAIIKDSQGQNIAYVRHACRQMMPSCSIPAPDGLSVIDPGACEQRLFTPVLKRDQGVTDTAVRGGGYTGQECAARGRTLPRDRRVRICGHDGRSEQEHDILPRPGLRCRGARAPRYWLGSLN